MKRTEFKQALIIAMGVDDTQFESAAFLSITDHRDILEAIEKQDEEKAHQLMEQHLTYRFTTNIVRN